MSRQYAGYSKGSYRLTKNGVPLGRNGVNALNSNNVDYYLYSSSKVFRYKKG